MNHKSSFLNIQLWHDNFTKTCAPLVAWILISKSWLISPLCNFYKFRWQMTNMCPFSTIAGYIMLRSAGSDSGVIRAWKSNSNRDWLDLISARFASRNANIFSLVKNHPTLYIGKGTHVRSKQYQLFWSPKNMFSHWCIIYWLKVW